MKRSDRRWLALLAGALVVVSAILYAIHFAFFREAHTMFFYLMQDLSFLPLEVLIVGLLIERLISLREKRSLQHKLNMVIGAFYSELGTHLLAELLPTMSAAAEIKERLHVVASWKKDDFARASQYARPLKRERRLTRIDREALRAHLLEKRQFVLRLLENPNLMEHERFTDLLWAVLHLEEELEARGSLAELSPPGEAHPEVDMRRAYNALLADWLKYVEHLKADYPYLFSLVVRMHPFQDAPSAIVAG